MSTMLTHFDTEHRTPQHLLVLNRYERTSLLSVVESAIDNGDVPADHQLHGIATALRNDPPF